MKTGADPAGTLSELLIWQHASQGIALTMKFLVVDDHALIRDAMREVLLALRPVAQVLEAADVRQALGLLDAHADVDLVLLDLQLPDGDGLDVLEDINRLHPAVPVVMLSGRQDPDTMRRALGRGAQGFIPKTEPRKVLAGALELVLAGGVYVPMAALGAATAPVAGPTAGPPTPASAGLTDRQVDVLALLMQGMNNKVICRALGLAEPTVKNHVSAILKVLGVASRAEAVLAVRRLGWTLPTPRPDV